jgi:uncharacterized membrane protein YccC
MWRLNPRAFQQLAPLGTWVGIPFLVLSAALACTAIGWFQRKRWSWWMAVLIIGMQVLGDCINFALGHLLEGATGVLIAGALLVYLMRDNVRMDFRSG